jgi:hypothetical protein
MQIIKWLMKVTLLILVIVFMSNWVSTFNFYHP